MITPASGRGRARVPEDGRGTTRRPARRARYRRPSRGDAGFTVTELAVSLVILSIAMALVSGLIVAIDEQSTAVRYSVQALAQTQLAGQTLVQYLRGATVILPQTPGTASAPVTANASTDDSDLTVQSTEGYNTSTRTAYETTICVQWVKPAGSKDAEFRVTFDCGTTQQRTAATYYALRSQAAPVFTYYKYSSGGQLSALAQVDPVPACAIGEIVAIGVHVTFLAGPQVPTGGFAADTPTTLQTIVYLHGDGLSGTGGTTTTTTSTVAPCSE